MPSFSGLWNNEYGENYSLLTSSARADNTRTALARVFALRPYSRGVVREMLVALIGAAPGVTASSTHKRVQAERNLEANLQGGKRVIETFTGINRATTAADVTYTEAALTQNPQPSYPVDRSGNGGGGKLNV